VEPFQQGERPRGKLVRRVLRREMIRNVTTGGVELQSEWRKLKPPGFADEEHNPRIHHGQQRAKAPHQQSVYMTAPRTHRRIARSKKKTFAFGMAVPYIEISPCGA